MEPEVRLNNLQQKVLDGVEVAPEEYEEVIAAIREARRAGAPKSKKKKSQGEMGQDLLNSLFDKKV